MTTAGELLVREALGPARPSVEDIFLWWPEPVLADKRAGGDRVPDFVILDRCFGFLVLEVKDWTIQQIVHAAPAKWEVRKGGVTRSETSPCEQAKTASHVLRNLLESSPLLVHVSGPHRGKARIPVEYGAVLSNISRADAQTYKLMEVLAGQFCFFSDDLKPPQQGISTFAQTLRAQVRPRFPVGALDEQDLQTIEDVVVPHRGVSSSPNLRPEGERLQIEKLDAEQTEFARALGEGHRVLTGCAGSGKTLVVAARAKFLKEANPLWRVRIICFNAELVPFIYRLLGDVQGHADPKIIVQNFHAYAREFLGDKLQRREKETDGEFSDRTVAEFIEVAKKVGPEGAFDALLIDEGQDLQADWTNALVGLVNQATRCVLFCASRQQNIYGRTNYKDLGIDAKGRTKHLRRSYRCSPEIIALAEAFQPDLLRQRRGELEAPENLSLFGAAEPKRRRVPQFVACPSGQAVAAYVCEEVRQLMREGQCDFRDIAVLYTDRFLPSLETLQTALCNQFGAQHVFAKWKAGRQLMPDEDSIKMTTIHGAKGLEWRVVFVLGLEKLPRRNLHMEGEKSLAYVALTRAQDEVHFISPHEEGFHKDLKLLGLTLTA